MVDTEQYQNDGEVYKEEGNIVKLHLVVVSIRFTSRLHCLRVYLFVSDVRYRSEASRTKLRQVVLFVDDNVNLYLFFTLFTSI